MSDAGHAKTRTAPTCSAKPHQFWLPGSPLYGPTNSCVIQPPARRGECAQSQHHPSAPRLPADRAPRSEGAGSPTPIPDPLRASPQRAGAPDHARSIAHGRHRSMWDVRTWPDRMPRPCRCCAGNGLLSARIDRRCRRPADATLRCAQSSSAMISLRRQNHGFQGGSYRAQTGGPCHLTPAPARASCNFFRFSS